MRLLFVPAALVFVSACVRPGPVGSQGPIGPQGISGKDGLDGSDGANGKTGNNGVDALSPSIYGRSTVSFIVSSDQELFTDRQASDCLVAAGVTLNVKSGVVIRCRGSFTIAGSINVEPLASGGEAQIVDGWSESQFPQSGVSNTAAGNGQVGAKGARVLGGRIPKGLKSTTIPTRIVRPGFFGGGGGGGSYQGGGSGGGTLTILAGGPITLANTGSIIADGGSVGVWPGNDIYGGAGGGGGGVIIIASGHSVTLNGRLSAKGGNGGQSRNDAAYAVSVGWGGGGGGGLIKIITPSLTPQTPLFDVSPGLSGEKVVTSASETTVFAGGAGGAGVGSGGAGSCIMPDGSMHDLGPAEIGAFYHDVSDPADAFL